MADNIENLTLELLKRIQAEQSASRDRDNEILSRLSYIESGLSRISRDQSLNYSEIVGDRHVVDKMRDRIDRIERRLDICDAAP
ncbi:MAG: hypothetical protein KGZ82_05715 [Bacteroidales bacterium]|nr:hypothetical protein [Bacteroidales bacterium]MBS4056794.1 hypothetical protein [Bacteroidales bacterium]